MSDNRSNQRNENRNEVTGMKINGPNHSNFNPYQKQLQKQVPTQNNGSRQDRLEISKQAKEMQGTDKVNPARQEKLDRIKADLETGNYKVDPQQTAKKMLQFWSNKE
ncbi:flagellar biosynthesis anti-sigma factor FlgM [Halobacillus salinarum]|uniref:Negative regulator of flagellin synthesis n=1 Tax=Halobacillus salinarum TaxID=2932257 RepID=A0ABY4ENF4_9BACI|nr:flagellar biosynthesis anti-sigma factor FlgM [Halobacillus salinarum]UOQ45724.1 flagellar biosynthesis anti-sigma factor FlgM [Halobacillus salinarum]